MDWGEELHERSKEWESVNGGGAGFGSAVPAKRGAGGGGIPDRPAAKKAKTTSTATGHGESASASAIMDDETMRKSFENNTIAKLTVSDLKSWLAGKKMGVGGKKQDLVERVEGYWEMK